MSLETFVGSSSLEALALAREAMGEDAVIVHTRHDGEVDQRRVEVVVALPGAVEAVARRQDRSPVRGDDPFKIALVGPTGGGKTTTLVKLALATQLLGHERVGVINLDTYRIGAMEQIGIYAQVGGFALENVYHQGEIAGAMDRLSDCDLILIDTPGRGGSGEMEDLEWTTVAAAVEPDEVHLVIPAHMSPSAARMMFRNFKHVAPTHVLPSKIDELPDVMDALSCLMRFDLPFRWLSDGQQVPQNLTDGSELLELLGVGPSRARRGAA